MNRWFIAIVCLLFCSCKTTTFYVVRHAEKATAASNMSSDVPLSKAGMERAQALKEKLNGKVAFVTSTQTKRTIGTAEPLAIAMNRSVHVYNHQDTILLKRYRKETFNMLFVGHSNTVDDVVNYLMNKKVISDLPDSAYGDLFIVKRKGKNFSFSKERFGK